LGRCVKEVDLCVDGVEDPPGVAWACALQKLPELAAIRTSIAIDEIVTDVDTPEDEDLARSSGVKAMGRISMLDLSGIRRKHAVSNLKLVDPLRLHTLNMWFDDVEPLYDMPALLQHLVALRDLELDMVKVAGTDDELDDNPAPATLPSLKTLKLVDVALEDSLRFAAEVTPGITTLTVEYDPSLFREPEGPPFKPTTDTLPKLRRLVVSGEPVFHRRMFGLVPHHVEQLYVKLRPGASRRAHVELFRNTFAFPVGLRELVLDIPSFSTVPRYGIDELEEQCRYMGIRFTLRRRYIAPRPTSRQAGPATWPDYGQAHEVEQSLEWAAARARWLCKTGDAQGIEEMAAMTAELKERRAIEQS